MNTQATYVIFHRADYDGLFCEAIARRYFVLEDVTYIGWNFGDPVPEIPREARLFILDLSIPTLMDHPGLIWIDHHVRAIERYPATIPGYRINGVAACRLAWQYFFGERRPAFAAELPKLDDYVERRVAEPLAVRLAGEYDVWDKRDPDAELFQHGLGSMEIDWDTLLENRPELGDGQKTAADFYVFRLLDRGRPIAYFLQQSNAKRITKSGFDLKWEGLTFLACNCGGGSLAFTAGIKPHHDALLAFMWRGRHWSVSLYGVPGKPDVDLSAIAIRLPGGGGHKQACGFECQALPFDIGTPRIPEAFLRGQENLVNTLLVALGRLGAPEDTQRALTESGDVEHVHWWLSSVAHPDAERLDWLDRVNRDTNERNGTAYGWRFEINHNRAALTDCNIPALPIRAAIDAARSTEAAR